MSIKHLKAVIWLSIMNLPMRGQWRNTFAKWGGAKLVGKHHFIGSNVVFDTVYPENITIGDHVHITSGVVLLTHFLDTSKSGINWKAGRITISEGAFIGTNSIICGKDIHIGEHAIVGAGSVVTKDIPANEIWAGNPATFIKKRPIIG